METRGTERRSCTRHPISWDGECHLREGYAMGHFRDISKHGAFFQPITELLGIPRGLAGEIPFIIRPGDRVSVTYELSPSGREVSCMATVRWVGTNPSHGEYGAGLELKGQRYKS